MSFSVNECDCRYSPKHVGFLKNYDVRAYLGSIEANSALEITVIIDKTEKICAAKFRAFGCNSKAVCGDAIIDLILNKHINEIINITYYELASHIKNNMKIDNYCSIYGFEIIKLIYDNYRGNSNSLNHEKFCKCSNITSEDIDNAILLHGVYTMSSLQNILNIDNACKSCENRIYSILAIAISAEQDKLDAQYF